MNLLSHKQRSVSEQGSIPLLILIAAVGIIAFLLVSNTFTFKDKIFSNLFPKSQSQAAELAQDNTLQILQLTKQLQSATTTAQRQSIIDQIVSINKQRVQNIQELMEDDPNTLLKLALDNKTKSILPSEIQNQVESQATESGTLYVAHGDDFKNNKAYYWYSIKKDNGQRLNLHFAHHTPNLASGTKVKVTGVEFGSDVAVDSADDNQSFQVVAPTSKVLGSQSNLKIASILVNLTDSNNDYFGASDVTDALMKNTLSVNNYYLTTSYGKVSFTSAPGGNGGGWGDVYGWYNINVSAATACSGTASGLDAVASAADNAATNAGVNISQYDEVVYWFPQVQNCSFGGLSYIGTGPLGHGESVINGFLPSSNYGIQEFSLPAHEVGHYLGADHAGAWSCTDGSGNRVAISSNCTHIEYGDPFDVMGNNNGTDSTYDTVTKLYHTASNFHRQVWNFTNSSNIQDVTTSGNYTIAPVSSGSGINTLRVARGNGQYYYLEFRQPNSAFDGFSGSDPVVNGVTIRVAPVNENGGSAKSDLIDTTPSTSSYLDSALGVGQTFTDSANNITIKTNSVSSSGASVAINFNGGGGGGAPSCTRSNPSVSIDPQSQYGNPGQGLGYTLYVTNNDSSACGSEQFNIGINMPGGGWTQSPGFLQPTINPGTTWNYPITVTSPSNASAGFYTFSESAAVSQATNFSAQASANYNVNQSGSGGSNLNSGLVSSWRMDEGSGNTVGDSQGSNTGSAINGSIVPGKINNARNFTGSGYISIPDNGSLAVSHISVSAWIHQTLFNNWASIYNRRNSSNQGFTLEPVATNPGHYQCQLPGNGGGIQSSRAVPDNSWSNIVCTYDGTTLTLYINGSQDSSGSFGGNINYGGSDSTFIGRNAVDGSQFNGTIDEVAVWNRALSSSEVSTLYNGGAGLQVPTGSTSNPTPTATPTSTPRPTATPTSTPNACVHHNPTVTLTPASTNNKPGDLIYFDTVVTDNDSGSCPGQMFELDTTLPGSSWSLNIPIQWAPVNLGPGGSWDYSSLLVFTPAVIGSGTYNLGIKWLEQNNPSFAGQAAASINISSTVQPTSTPRPTATPTSTPRPTATPTSTPRPTATPTSTPQPTATPTPPPGSASITASTSNIQLGQTLTISWSNIPNATFLDWISFQPASSSDGFWNETDWFFVSCSYGPTVARTNGSCQYTIPSYIATGAYNFRFYPNNGNISIAKTGTVTVGAAASTLAKSQSAQPPAITSTSQNNTINVSFNNIPNVTTSNQVVVFDPAKLKIAQVSLSSCKIVASSNAKTLTRGTCQITLPTGVAAGQYQVKMLNSKNEPVAPANLVTISQPQPTPIINSNGGLGNAIQCFIRRLFGQACS